MQQVVKSAGSPAPQPAAAGRSRSARPERERMDEGEREREWMREREREWMRERMGGGGRMDQGERMDERERIEGGYVNVRSLNENQLGFHIHHGPHRSRRRRFRRGTASRRQSWTRLPRSSRGCGMSRACAISLSSPESLSDSDDAPCRSDPSHYLTRMMRHADQIRVIF
jgi:hypothetical protein